MTFFSAVLSVGRFRVQSWFRLTVISTPIRLINTSSCSAMRSIDTICPIEKASSLNDSTFDCVVTVAKDTDSLPALIKAAVKALGDIDAAVTSSISLVSVNGVSGGRAIYSPTGPVDRDYDDVRVVYEAAQAGIKRALAAGSKKPLLVLPGSADFTDADLVATLGCLHIIYLPLELREAMKPEKADILGVYSDDSDAADRVLSLVPGLEAGRYVARDIGGSDPERMAPPRVDEYVTELFKDTCVDVSVTSDVDTLTADFPLLAAVNRASRNVNRHKGRVIFLTYEGEGEIQETLYLVGKGICYDTGGADIKSGGVMAGMHRDKCGAAAVAGFFQVLASLKPKNLKVVGGLAMVRNSVGSECYVADEIITSRANVRVRVGNTDAEGRMAMTDVLCRMKELALEDGVVNPKIFTWATLTGHVIIAHGPNYSAVMGNGPACNEGIPNQLIENGADLADPCALSTITREDYKFANGRNEYEDVLQCNNEPSSRTPRGHQFPAAFMIRASGLDANGKDSSTPLKYTHVDIAGSSGGFPGIPTAAPILAFAKTYVFNRL